MVKKEKLLNLRNTILGIISKQQRRIASVENKKVNPSSKLTKSLSSQNIDRIYNLSKDYRKFGGKTSSRSIVGKAINKYVVPRQEEIKTNKITLENQKKANKEKLFDRVNYTSESIKKVPGNKLASIHKNWTKIKWTLIDNGHSEDEVSQLWKVINDEKVWRDENYDPYERRKTLHPELHPGDVGRPKTGVKTKKEQAKEAAAARRASRPTKEERYAATHPQREVPVTVNGETNWVKTTHQGISSINVDSKGNLTTQFRRYVGMGDWAPSGENTYKFNLGGSDKKFVGNTVSGILSGTKSLGRFVNEAHNKDYGFSYKQTKGLKVTLNPKNMKEKDYGKEI